MSTKYTDEQRIHALNLLIENEGSISRTNQQTGIPERTLRDWRKKQGITTENGGKENFISGGGNELQELREKLMQHVFNLTASLSEHDELINHRAIAISRLLDRVFKIDEQINLHMKHLPQTIRIEYQYPDNTIHDKPYYLHNFDDD